MTAEIQAQQAGRLAEAAPRLRVLFFLRAINFDRIFECFLRTMLERGHEIRVLLDVAKQGLPPEETRLFDTLCLQYPSFSYGPLPPRRDAWLPAATALRHGIDFLRYLRPEFANAEVLRARARSRTPRLIRAALHVPPFRGGRGGLKLDRLLRRLEAAVPTTDSVVELIRANDPDVVLVSPLVGLGSPQGDYVRAATELGIPSMLLVASWDNLTNKGCIRDVPTLTAVWNDAQILEATRFHGIPPERVIAVGAHTYDHWFEWSSLREAAEFATRVGLDPAVPFLLYVGSSNFIAADEVPFVREWLGQLRSADDERLRKIGVLIRPHPQNTHCWAETDLEQPGRVVVWPRGGAAPTDAERKADYYDSLYHSRAVIGINTSALIEATIAGKPVFTVVSDHFRATQEGTVHFAHLVGDDRGDGALVVARSWEEHLAQLSAALEDPASHVARAKGFVARFIRPQGLHDAAAPRLADVVEGTAATAVDPVRRRKTLTRMLAALGAALGTAALLPRAARAARRRARFRVASARTVVIRAARRLPRPLLSRVGRAVVRVLPYLPAFLRRPIHRALRASRAAVVAARLAPPMAAPGVDARAAAPAEVGPREEESVRSG